MKKLLFLLLLIPFLGTSQGTFTAPVGYNTGAPTATPSGVGTRWRFDLLTGKKYTWNPDAMAWDEDPRGIDQISGCSAPLYTPGYNQSIFAVNGCTSGQGGPKLYLYNGSTWDCLNCASGPTYTAGTGIAISGGNVISNTGDLSATNELNTSLNVSGGNVRLTDPGSTLTLPVTDVAPVQSLVAGSGINITGSGSAKTIVNTAPNVVQVLSISGSDLSLSGGGGTVTLPGGDISWPLLAPDGDASAPSYSFENSPGTGLYYDGGALNISGQSEGVSPAKSITISPGSGTDNDGGGMTITSGGSTNGAGGKLTIRGGDGVVGGSFSMGGGNSSASGAPGGGAALGGGSAVGGGIGGPVTITGGQSDEAGKQGKVIIVASGFNFPYDTDANISLIAVDLLEPGLTVFCVDCTANDASTGVLETWNGSAWKKHW